jgi:hypothetical protein
MYNSEVWHPFTEAYPAMPSKLGDLHPKLRNVMKSLHFLAQVSHELANVTNALLAEHADGISKLQNVAFAVKVRAWNSRNVEATELQNVNAADEVRLRRLQKKMDDYGLSDAEQKAYDVLKEKLTRGETLSSDEPFANGGNCINDATPPKTPRGLYLQRIPAFRRACNNYDVEARRRQQALFSPGWYKDDGEPASEEQRSRQRAATYVALAGPSDTPPFGANMTFPGANPRSESNLWFRRFARFFKL